MLHATYKSEWTTGNVGVQKVIVRAVLGFLFICLQQITLTTGKRKQVFRF